MKKAKIVTLDVRPDLARGDEPFGKIMAAVSALRDGEQLKLIAPFEPQPLFSVMAMQGFHHEAKPIADGGWEVIFTRTDSA